MQEWVLPSAWPACSGFWTLALARCHLLGHSAAKWPDCGECPAGGGEQGPTHYNAALALGAWAGGILWGDLERRSPGDSASPQPITEAVECGRTLVLRRYPIVPSLGPLGGCRTYRTIIFSEERVHHSLDPQLPPGVPPRLIISSLLNYWDTIAVLRIAHEKWPVHHSGNIMLFFPDFTKSVQAIHRDFIPVTKILQKAKLLYALLYPSKLLISVYGQSHVFTDAHSELKLAKLMIKKGRSPGSSAVAAEWSSLSENDWYMSNS
ncbi:hypothetical protein NDU88_000837 [Pleurodeles waltl]|uniref:Uncharacterized protein n=1 Tax=Pleurodeles waltl TaxID=8319 RepID=A0AAV7SXH8_PLEWA|nr:hypothetical protein NDU88_000837 [Pleurodeles waltl]